MVGIYKITSPSGKIYIGQSRNIYKRWSGYKKLKFKNQRALFRSFKKHGIDVHVFEIAYRLPDTVSQTLLDNYECFYINQFKEGGFKLLNLKDGGYKGKHSDESKLLMSKNQKGIIRPNFTGKKHSDESKKKTSDKLKGRVFSKEHKEKISVGSRGKKMSKEAIEKSRSANTGRKASNETKEKQRLATTGRVLSAETKLKISLSNKGKKQTPEHIENHRKSMLGKKFKRK